MASRRCARQGSVPGMGFGGQITEIRPGEIQVVKAKIPAKGGFMPFMLGDPSGNIVFETRLFGQPAGREMVFIGNAAKPEGQPKVMFLTQVIPPCPARMISVHTSDPSQTFT